MDIEKLVNQFAAWQEGEGEPLTREEADFLCKNEDHDIFGFSHSFFREILDYRDYLDLEEGA